MARSLARPGLPAIFVAVLVLAMTLGIAPTATAQDTADPPAAQDAPEFSEAQVDGATLDIELSTKLDTSSVPAVGDFAVMVGEAVRTVSSVVIPSRHFARLTLSERVVEGETVTVAYTKGDSPLRDPGGNEVDSFEAQTVTNLTAPSPTLISAGAYRYYDGAIVQAHFRGVLDGDSLPPACDFTVTVDGSSQQVTSVRLASVIPNGYKNTVFTDASGREIPISQFAYRSILRIELSAPLIAAGSLVTLAYTKGATPLRDDEGNEVATFDAQSVVNTSDPPKLVGTEVDGTHLVLYFDQLMLASPTPGRRDFTVRVDGDRRNVKSVQIPAYTATYVNLTLYSAVASGKEVTIDYTKGEHPLQEENGDQVANFSAQTVQNVAGPPEFRWATVDGSIVRLSFSPRPDFTRVPSPRDFDVTVGGATRDVGYVQVLIRSYSSLTREVVLTLRQPVAADDYVTVAYTAGSRPLRHEGGGAAPSFGAMPVENVTTLEDGPELTLGTGISLVTFTGSLTELREAATEACPLGVEFFATVDGEYLSYVPDLDRRIANRAFEEAFADGLATTPLLASNCRTSS